MNQDTLLTGPDYLDGDCGVDMLVGGPGNDLMLGGNLNAANAAVISAPANGLGDSSAVTVKCTVTVPCVIFMPPPRPTP